MGFLRFRFSKLWTNPTDFTTIETDEVKVRADMQLLHDEAKEGLNSLMAELEASDAAGKLGALAPDGETASNVQQELQDLNEAKHTHEKSDEELSKAVNDRHTHENKGVLDQITEAFLNKLNTLFGSIESVVSVLGKDDSTIPTSKAVSDALTQAGNIPAGGSTGHALIKASDENYDIEWGSVASLGADGKVPAEQLPEISSVKSYTATIGAAWVEDEETGVKSQSVAISGVAASNTAKVDHAYTGNGSSDSYATFVEEENQYLEFITNGYAETYDGGITFYIFGDVNTVSIPIVVEVA